MTNLICLGDSITDCGRIFFHPPLGNGYVHMLSEKLHLCHKNWNITNCGVDGFTITRLLENAERQYLPLNPDIITVLIGINDMGLMMNSCHSMLQQKKMQQIFLKKYDALLQCLSTSARQIILMEPFIFSYPSEFQRWIPHVREMSMGISSLADKYHLPYILLQNQLDDAVLKHGSDFITIDGIHLTQYGHKILAEALFAVLSPNSGKD